MKILLLSEVFPPQTGGSGRWFWEVYSRLPREWVCIAAGMHPDAAAFDAGHDLNIVRLPLAMPEWGLRSIRGLRGYWGSFGRLRRLVREQHVQSLHAGRVLPEGWVAWMLRTMCGLPYTIYVHGEELSYSQHSRELGWMMRRVFARAEKVIVNCRNTQELLLREWSIDPARVHVLNPGVDGTRFRPASADPGSQKGRQWGGRPVVLTVGRLQQRKGHDMLIRALPHIRRAVPEILYVIVGDGDQRTALECLARELGVEGCIEFRGEIDDTAMIECYQQCDLFVLPNRNIDGDIEGFGIVLLEAQACGRPVIAGASGGTAETMRIGETGEIIDCTSPEPLASAIVRLLADPARRQKMGETARRWILEHFDWSILTGEAAEIFGLPDKVSPVRSASLPVEVSAT